jgi:hypothetical protein
MRRLGFGLIIAAALCAAPIVAAGSRTPVTAATITLNVPATTLDTFSVGQWPNLGDMVSFTVTYPKSVDKYAPRIQVMCYQNETLVWATAAHYYEGILLGGASSPWVNDTPGPAHCVADLFYLTYHGSQKFNWLASTEFDAGGN